MTIKKSGFVAIVGRPNVGKSTLLNALLGEKVSIISPKPQTTRWQVLGIKTTDDAQIIYIDTPGMHQEEKRAMNRYMNRVANAALHEVDVVVFLVEAMAWYEDDALVLKNLAVLQDLKKPVILAINKIDLIKDKALLLPFMKTMEEKFDFLHIIPIAAKQSTYIEGLEQEIIKLLPEGPALYPVDQITDKSERFQIAEIIREKIIYATAEELPYATTVEIEQLTQTEKVTEISAVIWVERPGQKVIVIGKGGAKLKRVGMQARKEIEALLGTKVFLRLWVKVKAQWSDDDKALKGLGYE